ncbi:hypothetical protein [Methylomonas albis]|uniref:Uncharacterized protein n=1 Tax=Methylomonas albis TaxID=1854563 RepID=A0ABR9D9A0_9GAMM|nr:hypothetical protein [Methylomonas albis]MBD9358838.1 hypothetical protein [Methylomonas albis]
MDIGVIGNKIINLHIIDRLFAARSLFIADRQYFDVSAVVSENTRQPHLRAEPFVLQHAPGHQLALPNC